MKKEITQTEEKLLRMLNKQKLGLYFEHEEELNLIIEESKESVAFLLNGIFQYGVILGKRIERQRHKKNTAPNGRSEAVQSDGITKR